MRCLLAFPWWIFFAISEAVVYDVNHRLFGKIEPADIASERFLDEGEALVLANKVKWPSVVQTFDHPQFAVIRNESNQVPVTARGERRKRCSCGCAGCDLFPNRSCCQPNCCASTPLPLACCPPRRLRSLAVDPILDLAVPPLRTTVAGSRVARVVVHRFMKKTERMSTQNRLLFNSLPFHLRLQERAVHRRFLLNHPQLRHHLHHRQSRQSSAVETNTPIILTTTVVVGRVDVKELAAAAVPVASTKILSAVPTRSLAVHLNLLHFPAVLLFLHFLLSLDAATLSLHAFELVPCVLAVSESSWEPEPNDKAVFWTLFIVKRVLLPPVLLQVLPPAELKLLL
ncbi:hypothetical protein L596_010908 [Steinernema carpocapsae]|uniref:Uncharacterized protein n=1 Tax=Steinernema carpocapsae TaxID=34508 RepID=A0A4U5PKX7_STECR|nr:hypothetical protein L596_010908 [Steinernema carpocapsae]